MTATSTTASSLPPVRTSCHVPLSLMTSISEETIALWLKLGALEKLEQAVLDGYGDQLCGKTSRIPQVNKFLKQVPLFQNKIREIHQAVSQGRLRDVQHLIDRKKLAFCRDHNGASPLHKAVIFGHQDVIEYLVKRYAGSIHIRDHQGRTALHYATFLPDQGEIYQYLLANGADERAMDVYGRQPSYYLDGQNENTLRQLRDGSTLNSLRKIKPRYYGQVSAGQTFPNSNRPTITKSQIRELISEGNLNALEDLVLQGQGDRLLGETSSVPKIQSFLSIVPTYMERIYDVHRAVMRDQLEHIVILLENKKLALARDQLGATPLHKAVLFGHYKIAHYISHQFPDVLNAVDMEGRTALHYAAALKDNKNMYGILIEAGLNKGLYDNKGKTADYYAQYPEHLNLEDVIKRCHKVNANYLANTASRIKGKSPVRQTPPPSNGNLSSPRSDENNSSSKDTSQSNDSGNENELISLLQKDKLPKRLDMSSANIRRWVNAKDMDKLTKAVMEGYGDKVIRVNTNEELEDKEQITGKITEMVERINAIHSAVSSDDLSELQNHLEERDFALAKDHVGNTPLHKSVLLRKTKISGYLIEKFPETINAKNKNGLTALHYAAAMSRKDGLQIYKMLLQAGADPKIRDNHGRTPDYYKTHLITLPNKGIMKTRPAGGRHSETLNRYSKQGVLERMTAALQRGDVELLQDLVLEGHGKHLFGKTSWNEDVKTFLKELPSYLNKIQLLHESVKNGDVDIVKDLITSNERLMRARDESGSLPIHLAAASESPDVLDYFTKNYPSALNMKDSTGKTVLHIASQKGNVTLCKMLKQAGADPKILDQKGKTAEFYLQNIRQDGSKTEYDSSKSTLNSSSESSYSAMHTEKRRRRPKLIKKDTLREKSEEKLEERNGDGDISTNNDGNIKNTENKTQDDSENDRNSPENESLNKDECKSSLANEAEQSENTVEMDDNSKEQGDRETENNQDDNTEKDQSNEIRTESEINGNSDNLNGNETGTEPLISNEDIITETEIDQLQNENCTNADEINDSKGYDNIENNEMEVTNDQETVSEFKNENSGNGETLEESDKKGDDIQRPDNSDQNDNEHMNIKEEGFAELGEETKNAEIEENNNQEQINEDKSDIENYHNDVDAERNQKAEDDTKHVENFEEKKEESEDIKKDEEGEKENIALDPHEEINKKIENNSEGVTVAEVGSRKKESVDNTDLSKEENEIPHSAENAESKQVTDEEGDKINVDENIDHHDILDDNRNDDKALTEEKDIEEIEKKEKDNDVENMENDEKRLNEDQGESIEKNNGDDEKNELKESNDNDQNDEAVDTEHEKIEDDKETTEPNSEIQNETESYKEKEEAMNMADNITNPRDSKINSQEETSHQTKDHLDELIEHWIKEGDLLRLEHVVLAGQGDRLIERTSEDKQVQDFLDLVPIYMAKIRAVHEAVAKGLLREVRSVLTRKRFALSRDHVGASPLHLAILYGHADVSTYIISHFPETMDGPDNEGRTPLHYATAVKDSGTLYRLLKMAGADENIEDKAGHSPKYYMSNPGQLTIDTLMEPYSATE